RGCLQPATLSLERGGWQTKAPPEVAAIETVPVHGNLAEVQGGEALQQSSPIVAGRGERGQPHARTVRQAPPGQVNERRARADFQNDRTTLFVTTANRVGEAHRLPRVTPPVTRGGQLFPSQLPRDVGYEGQTRRGEGHSGGGRFEVAEHRLEQGGVEGVR